MPCEFEDLGYTAMPWPLFVFLGKTVPCLTVEIILHRGQSMVRSLRNAVVKSKLPVLFF